MPVAEPVDPTSFLPVALIEQLAAEPGAHCACSLPGAALFADISGYVKITEQFCERGTRGLEQLSALLNASFSRYVDVVYELGGEVVHFAGDGLAAYWSAGAGGLEESAERALRCAIALRELERATESNDRANPNLHLGVAAGALWAARIKSLEDHIDVLLGGPALRRAARAEAAGARGEVVVSGEVVELLGGRLHAVTRGNGHYLVESLEGGTLAPRPSSRQGSRVDRDSLRRMLPGAIAHVPPADLRWTAELRRVCTLFARIDGLDEMLPSALGAFRNAASTVHETMRAFSSTPGQLLIDDKGLVFLAVFGVPYNAHANDAERAAHAALALTERLRAIGLSCSVGLSAGPAFCGVLGSDRRRAYATVGRPMNIAARLMTVGEHGVLCATDEPRVTLQGIAHSPTEPLRVKGLERSLPTYRLRRMAGPTSRGRVFGRKAEQAHLRAKLEELAAGGRGGTVAIVGEAGFGKSSLVRELCELAAGRAIPIAFGEAVASPSAVYSAWRGVFLSVFGLDTTAPQAEASARVQQALARWPELLPLAPLLNAVLPIELEETSVTRHLDGQKRADASLHLLSTALDRLAHKPLLAVLEDGHWMDSPSLRLVEAVAQHAQGILLVIALRPMAPGEGLGALPKDSLTVLELAPLAKEELNALVRETLGDEVAAEVTAAVSKHTYGNPLFAHEYTLLLRERGLLQRRNGSYGFESADHGLSGLSPPSSVQATITSRLDNLGAVERLALKTASVVGQAFDAALVASVYPVQQQRQQVAEALSVLCGRKLIERLPQATERYAFRHALIREVAYGVMLHEQRSALHGAVGAALEAGAGPQDHALLAHHFKLAGDRPKTWHYADLAASSALRAGAYREALGLLETRLALGTEMKAEPIQLVRIQRQLADAYEGLGDNPARDARARSALELALPPWRVRRPVSTLEALGRMALYGVAPFLHRTAPDARVQCDLELARAFGHRAEVCYYTSDALGLLGSHLATISRAQRCGPCPELSSAYAELGGSLGIMGLHKPAQGLIERAIDVAQAIEDPLALAHAHMIRALYSVGIARFSSVQESVQICQEICERMQDPITWNQAQMIAFWAAHYLGRVEQSGALARTLLGRAEKAGHRQHTVWGLRALAVYELANDAPVDALGYAERAASFLSGSEHANELVSGWGVCALSRMRAGDGAGARDAAERGLAAQSSSRRQTAHSTLAGWAGLAEVALSARQRDPDADAWRCASERALTGLARHSRAFSVGEPTYLYFRGLADSLEGRQRRARARFRRGLLTAERLGAVRDRPKLLRALQE